ncbi:hypothetical protein DSM112329_00893 [Paraconexibacter sp. AEG42_29]|uniref:Uncharacterized protein n=1 Tax=Paraconexibacter sp. AEG42_29 TaxID=2997339 RepID=A0AAU7AR22_9ACTN
MKGVSREPASSGRAAAAAPPSADAGPVERAKASWKAAGDLAPNVVKTPGQKPKAVMRPSASLGSGGGTAAERRRRRAAAKPDRPAALWGKAPISEFAIAIGLIVFLIGLARGPGSPAISGGLIFISIAAIEFAGREHIRGYRSHTLFLSMMVVVAVHLSIALIVGAKVARGPAFIAGDVILFGVLASALSKQYSIARLDAVPKKGR